MTLQAGSRLGPYEILSALGAGGMGEVYRAKDTRLDRTVAIKVLPPDVAKDPERRQRFEREARAVSSLSHPHICALYDIGQQDGVDYLVMEHLEGQTLAERLQKGPLPTDQVLRYGIEIADALDKAHRHGIVHRDLKPSNVMLTKSGAKLLDFGLAKTAKPVVTSDADLSALATRAKPLTEKGTLLGTVQYMAPEQIEGREADARTDIWALGALLYETVTGKRAFVGNSPASLIGAILKDEPRPITQLQPVAPPALERLVMVCLAKDPDERMQTAHDVMQELKWIAEGSSSLGGPAVTTARSRRREHAGWVVGILGIALAGSSVTLRLLGRNDAAPPSGKAFIPAPSQVRFNFTGDLSGPPVLSSDGRHLAFAGIAEGRQLLFVRALDDEAIRPLNGADGALFPFWSPDGRSLGFFAEGKLKRVELAGGPAVNLADAPEARGGAWGPNGTILFTPSIREGIYQVAATGGAPAAVTKLDESLHTTHRWPAFLPDGRHFLFLAARHSSNKEDTAIYAGSFDGKDPKRLVRATGKAAYASGYLLYLAGSALMAQPFDAKSLVLSGEPVPVTEVQPDPGTWGGVFSASQNGVMVYQGGAMSLPTLTWFDRSGKALGTMGEPDRVSSVRLSPDGRKVAASVGDPAGDIWIYDVERGTRARLTFDEVVLNPIWSPDGSRIAYGSYSGPGGKANIFVKPATGAGPRALLLESRTREQPTDWTRDGRYIVFSQGAITIGTGWVLPLFGDHKAFPLLSEASYQADATVSPDGRWIAYQSRESGSLNIYVTSFPTPSGKWQVSTKGGQLARWRGDGRELFFAAGDGVLTAAEVSGQGSTFEVTAVRPLFRPPWTQGGFGGVGVLYDVSADGQRILVVASSQVDLPPLTLFWNWPAGLAGK